MIKINKDRATGLIVIGAGIFFTLLSLQLPPSRMPEDIGPKVFPIIACSIMILCGTGLIIQKTDEAKEGEKRKPFFSKLEWKRFLVLLGAYILYFVLLYTVGFIPATLIAMFIVSTLFSEGRKEAVWKRIVFSVIVTTFIYIAFYRGLGLRLPLGKFLRIDL
ncbi:MAG: tripartite tricarboxylate transporter TctB family protein [Spirochaetaceae bacterium]|jgi:putative tricarboxylic transport membrane protein|nr:tripartite tricarboxylate transporter TctB family protein [Spirochaetaceae bacterium]